MSERRKRVADERTVERESHDELAMQPHGHAPHAADDLAVDIHLIGQDPFLGPVELIGEALGIMVERLDHLPGDRLEQGGGRLHLDAAAERSPGRFDGVQLMPAAGDEQGLGQGKMQKADLLGGAVEPADEIGKDAVEAGLGPMQLLMLVAGDEERARRLGKVGRGRQELAGARIGEVEMEPEPAAFCRHRLFDIELLRRPVRIEPKGEHEACQGLILRFRDIAGRLCL